MFIRPLVGLQPSRASQRTGSLRRPLQNKLRPKKRGNSKFKGQHGRGLEASIGVNPCEDEERRE